MQPQINSKKNAVNLNFSVMFNPGTTSSRISALQRAFSVQDSSTIAHRITTEQILFDFKRHAHEDLPSLAGLDVVSDDRDDACFIRATLPIDGPSLQKAESAGKLYVLPEGWHCMSGPNHDNLGAAGQPRWGAALVVLKGASLKAALQKALGSCTSHDKHQQLVMRGMDTDVNPARIPIICTASLPTGTGNGASTVFVPRIKKLADDVNVPVKVIFNAILRGNLPVDDPKKAKLNESNILKLFLASASGQLVDSVSGWLREQFFDQLLLSSNLNGWGQLSSLEQLAVGNAYRSFLLWTSPVSGQIQERLVDNEYWDFDKETGEPLVGFTLASSSLKWDRQKVRNYCMYSVVSLLAGVFSQKQTESEAKQQALTLAQMHQILESDEDSVVTGRLLGSSDSKDQSTILQLRSNFADRAEDAVGLDRANSLQEGLHSIDSNDIEIVYGKSMSEQANHFLDRTQKSLDSRIEQALKGKVGSNKQEFGWFDVYSELAAYRDLADGSRRTIMEKVGQIQQFIEPHREVMNGSLEELERIRNLPRWRSFFYHFRLRRICECLESSGLIYLECRLQIVACTIAVQLLDHLIDFVDDKLSELSLLNQNLRQVHAACKQKADNEVSRPTLISLMPGPDLVTEDYLGAFFDEVVVRHNSRELFIRDLIARFLSQYQSLSTLAGKSPDEIEDILSNVCSEVFEPWISQRNVITEFQKLYPHETQQRNIFRELVRQSEGGVRTVGESDRQIVWTKFVIVPAADGTQQIRNIVAKVDDKQGNWHPLVHGNPDTITLLQFRGGISIASLINGMKLPDNPETWQRMVELAVDPFTAMMTLPNPTVRQVRRVFVKAVVNGQLEYDENTGFELTFSDDKPIPLGKDPQDATKALRTWWPYIVRIESTFGHRIVVDDRAVARRVEELKESLASSGSSDPCFALLDERAIQEVKTQLDLLIPRAERLRAACKEGGLGEV